MGLRTRRNARAKLVSWRKLYGAYLTGDAELYDAYLTYHTGKVRQASGSAVCMRLKGARPVTTYAKSGRTRVIPSESWTGTARMK